MQAQFGGKYPHLFRGSRLVSLAPLFDSPAKCPAVPSGGDWVALATVLMSDVPAFALKPAKTDPAHQSDERW